MCAAAEQAPGEQNGGALKTSPFTMCALALTAILLLSSASGVHPSAAARYPIPFQRSVVSEGDETMLNRVFDKLERQQCLNVMVLGGSVTCAVSLAVPGTENYYPDGPRHNHSYAWPAFFEMHLNAQHPCKAQDGTASKHRVHNGCAEGVGTDVWVELFSGITRYESHWDGRSINNTDLVVVDTSMNDVEGMAHKVKVDGGQASDVVDAIQRATEALMVLLLHNETAAGTPTTTLRENIHGDLPLHMTSGRSWSWSGIACIWLGVGQRAGRMNNLWDGTWPRQGDSVHIHLPMAQRHGVPYVSVIDGFGPFTTLESQMWYWNVFRGDWCCHISIQGHMLLGELLFNFVQTRLEDRQQRVTTRPWPYGNSNAHSPYQIRKPAMLSSWDVVRLMSSDPLRIDLQGTKHVIEPLNTTVVPCAGFSFADDGHHKPGLLSYATGSACHFLVPNNRIKKHLLLWQIHIKLLKSYNNTGVLGVQVFTVNCNVDQGINNQQLLGSMEESCLWEKRYSLATVVQMELKKPDAVSDSTCLLVTFNNLPWTNLASTKVKIYDFVLF